jgi:hypothetical protein
VSARRILVVGAGKRALETALPALVQMHGELEVEAVCGRNPREIAAGGRTWRVEALAGLARERLERCEFTYVAVGKPNVARVLAALLERGAGRTSLLLETPGLLLKHLRHRPLLERFRSAWIAEDCAALPWLELALEAFERAELGPPRAVVFVQSAYAYHGVATARALLKGGTVACGRRARSGDKSVRWLRFDTGGTALVLEPRNYGVGRLAIASERGLVSDGAEFDPRFAQALAPFGRELGAAAGQLEEAAFARALVLAPELERGECVALRCGGLRREFDLQERGLLKGAPAASAGAAGVVQRMDAMKRVGFLRLLRGLLAGKGAHPVELGLEDMLVDWWLERAGRWRSTAVTSLRSPVGRALYGAISRVAGR